MTMCVRRFLTHRNRATAWPLFAFPGPRYAGLANAPMFVAKLFVGGLSGVLLSSFCPEVAFACCLHLHLQCGRPLMCAALRATRTDRPPPLQHNVVDHWRHCVFFACVYVPPA